MPRNNSVKENSIARNARAKIYATPAEHLRILLNQEKPPRLVPGTSRLYCYWKIKIHLDIAKKDVDLFVPPEWRMIEGPTLKNWVNLLRYRPCEDIKLGETQYTWIFDTLVPEGQDFATIPRHGERGWPENDEPTYHWKDPLPLHSNGKALRVSINRRHPGLTWGLEKVVCYWPLVIPRTSQEDPTPKLLWVPPEWRRLTKTALKKWANLLITHSNELLTLGGTVYQWHGSDIIPMAQDPTTIEYMGRGIHVNVQIEGVVMTDLFEPILTNFENLRLPGTSAYPMFPHPIAPASLTGNQLTSAEVGTNERNPEQEDSEIAELLDSLVQEWEGNLELLPTTMTLEQLEEVATSCSNKRREEGKKKKKNKKSLQ